MGRSRVVARLLLGTGAIAVVLLGLYFIASRGRPARVSVATTDSQSVGVQCIGLINADTFSWSHDTNAAKPTPSAALEHIRTTSRPETPFPEQVRETAKGPASVTLAGRTGDRFVLTATAVRVQNGWVITSMESCAGEGQ